MQTWSAALGSGLLTLWLTVAAYDIARNDHFPVWAGIVVGVATAGVVRILIWTAWDRFNRLEKRLAALETAVQRIGA